MPEMDPNYNVTDLRRKLAAAQAERDEWIGHERAARKKAEKAEAELAEAEKVREAAEQAKMLLGGGVVSYETPAGVVIARAYEILRAALGVK